MQEQRRFATSTVSRRLSVIGGFYRACVIDGIYDRAHVNLDRHPDYIRSAFMSSGA